LISGLNVVEFARIPRALGILANPVRLPEPKALADLSNFK
jgi:hypothetical protein